MEKITVAVRDKEIRERVLATIIEHLKANGEEVLAVGTGKVACPATGSDGSETAFTVEVKIPRGPRGGNGYDVYEAAQEWQEDVEAKAETARIKAEDKATLARAKAKKEKGDKVGE